MHAVAVCRLTRTRRTDNQLSKWHDVKVTSRKEVELEVLRRDQTAKERWSLELESPFRKVRRANFHRGKEQLEQSRTRLKQIFPQFWNRLSENPACLQVSVTHMNLPSLLSADRY